MKIDNKLIQEGFNESIILFYHNRTKQSGKMIVSAFLFKKGNGTSDGNDNHFVKVELVGGRVVCYEMNLGSIRQKKLNLFLSK